MKNGLFQKTENDLKHKVSETLWAGGWHRRDKLSTKQMSHRSLGSRTPWPNPPKELHGGHNHIFLETVFNTQLAVDCGVFFSYYYWLALANQKGIKGALLVCSKHSCGGQKTIYGSGFFSPIMWSLGIVLYLLSHLAGPIISSSWVVSLVFNPQCLCAHAMNRGGSLVHPDKLFIFHT